VQWPKKPAQHTMDIPPALLFHFVFFFFLVRGHCICHLELVKR